MPPSVRKEWFVFTYNWYFHVEIEALETMFHSEESIRGLVFQEEVAPTTGTMHLQGTIRFSSLKTWAAVRELFSRYLTVEESDFVDGEPEEDTPRNYKTYLRFCRNPGASVNYCSDENKRAPGGECWIFGDVESKQGSRSDLYKMMEDIAAGVPEVEIAEEYPTQWCQYSRPLKEYRKMKIKQKVEEEIDAGTRRVTTHVVWGTAGAGKTTYVYDREKRSDVYLVSKAKKKEDKIWWDDYEGQPVLLFDDFYGPTSGLSYDEFLVLTDPYPKNSLRLQTKGNHVYPRYSRIYFTSNRHPNTWYQKQQCIEHGQANRYQLTAAMERRLGILQPDAQHQLHRVPESSSNIVHLSPDYLLGRDFSHAHPLASSANETETDTDRLRPTTPTPPTSVSPPTQRAHNSSVHNSGVQIPVTSRAWHYTLQLHEKKRKSEEELEHDRNIRRFRELRQQQIDFAARESDYTGESESVNMDE